MHLYFRSDDLPDEEVFYGSKNKALDYYNGQKSVLNDLCFAAQLISINGSHYTIEETTIFALTEMEQNLILKVGCEDQLDTCIRLKQILPLLPDDNAKQCAILTRIKIENLAPSKFLVLFDLIKRQKMT